MNILLILAGLTLIIVGTVMTLNDAPTPPAHQEPIAPPLVEEPVAPPSLADEIRSIGETWEAQRIATQEFHNKNYMEYGAIVVGLMERLGVETVTVGNTMPDTVYSLSIQRPDNGTEAIVTIQRK